MAYSVSLRTVPLVVFKDDQLLVIKISTARGDLLYGFVHAANNYVARHRLWAAMLELGTQSICFFGDFNAAIGADKQYEQRCLSRISYDEFRHCISDSGLIDLETMWPFFTWRCSNSSRVLRRIIFGSFHPVIGTFQLTAARCFFGVFGGLSLAGEGVIDGD